jgi:hypothetical protein
VDGQQRHGDKRRCSVQDSNRADRRHPTSRNAPSVSARPLVLREVLRVGDDLNDAEQRILLWLLDQNPIQRVIVKTAAGKTDVVAEHDLSGGLNAFMNLLESDAPISRRIRDALRRSVDPMGISILHLAKRPRRARGRPGTDDTLRGFLRHEYNVRVHPEKTAKAEKKVKKRRAAGTHSKKVTVEEKILELGVSRSEHYRRLRAAKRLKQKQE